MYGIEDMPTQLGWINTILIMYFVPALLTIISNVWLYLVDDACRNGVGREDFKKVNAGAFIPGINLLLGPFLLAITIGVTIYLAFNKCNNWLVDSLRYLKGDTSKS